MSDKAEAPSSNNELLVERSRSWFSGSRQSSDAQGSDPYPVSASSSNADTRSTHSASALADQSHHLSGFAAGTAIEARDLTFAKITADVYNHTTGEVGQWHPISNDEIEKLGLKANLFHDDQSHFKAALYTDGEGHYALAFRGTHPMSNRSDWLTNVGQALGERTGAYDDAITLGAAVSKKLGADNVVMVGHSLGGGLAEAASLASGSSAVTFNAPGLSDATIHEAGWPSQRSARAAMDRVSRNYSVDGEILTSLQDNSLGLAPAALGHQLWLADPEPTKHPDASPMSRPGGENYAPYFVAMHSVWLHDIKAVIESLENEMATRHLSQSTSPMNSAVEASGISKTAKETSKPAPRVAGNASPTRREQTASGIATTDDTANRTSSRSASDNDQVNPTATTGRLRVR